MVRRARSKWAKSERKIEAPFVPFPAEMIESAAFHALSGSSFKLLFLLGTVWARHGGLSANINGEIVVSYERFIKFWKMDRHTVAAALRELVALGFVERKKGCAGNADEREPNAFRLRFLPSEGVPATGSHEWRGIATDEQAETIRNEARRAAEDDARRVRRRRNTTVGAVTDVTDKNAIPVGAGHGSRCDLPTPKGVTRHGYVTAIPVCEAHTLLNISACEGSGAVQARSPAAPSVARPQCETCGMDLLSRRSRCPVLLRRMPQASASAARGCRRPRRGPAPADEANLDEARRARTLR